MKKYFSILTYLLVLVSLIAVSCTVSEPAQPTPKPPSDSVPKLDTEEPEPTLDTRAMDLAAFSNILIKLNKGDSSIKVESTSISLPTKGPYETQADFDRKYEKAKEVKEQAEENSRLEYNRLFEAKYNGTEIIVNPGISYDADRQIANISSVAFKAPTYNWYPAGGGSEQTSMAVGFSPGYLFETSEYRGSATLSFPAVSLALEEARRLDVVAEQGELILRFDFNADSNTVILTNVEWRIQSTTLMRWDVGINATNLIPSLWPSGLTEVDEETGAISVTGFILNAENGKYNEGELISVSGTVEGVGRFKYMAYYAGYRVVFKTTGDINVYAKFDGNSEDIEQVKALQNGQKIIVRGKFDNVLSWDFLALVDCSLLTR